MILPDAPESGWIVIVNPRYAWRSFPRTLTVRPQAGIRVYNAQHHVVCVRIQRLRQLMDNDHVTLAYLSKELPNGPAQNEYGKEATRNRDRSSWIIAVIRRVLRTMENKYRTRNIVKNGWMKVVKKGLCKLRAST